MSNRNNRPKAQQSIRPSADPSNDMSDELAARSLTLRLPERLHENARQFSASCGVSVNGLICIALADYLAARGYPFHSLGKSR